MQESSHRQAGRQKFVLVQVLHQSCLLQWPSAWRRQTASVTTGRCSLLALYRHKELVPRDGQSGLNVAMALQLVSALSVTG